MAIWHQPFIFQGSFSITDTRNNTNQLLFFRCECTLKNKMDILDADFSPDDYKFTHLYDMQAEIQLENPDNNLDQALYLLKYCFKKTLEKMVSDPNQHLTHIDEIAMSSITKLIQGHMIYHDENKINDDNIGFAVSITFTPTEIIGKKSAMALLKINKYRKHKSNLH